MLNNKYLNKIRIQKKKNKILVTLFNLEKNKGVSFKKIFVKSENRGKKKHVVCISNL